MDECTEVHNEQKMRMCILGGGGYLGQSLASQLQADGHYVVLYDLNFLDFPNIDLDPANVQRIQGSILDRLKLRKALLNCDACFHLAGYGMIGGASLERKMIFSVNVDGTNAVIAECRLSTTVRRLIFSSSITVLFDGSNELHFADENTPYAKNFANAYAESKCLAEKAILAANAPPSLSTCALRLRGIYGPGEVRTVERAVDMIAKGYVKMTFQKSENCLTQYSSAENCVNAMVLAEKALRREDSPAAGSVYNILDGGPPVNPWEFWFPLIEHLGHPLPRHQLPYPIAYALAFICEMLYHLCGVEPLFTRFEVLLMSITNTFSIERAERELGYRPIRSHDLRPTIQFYREPPENDDGLVVAAISRIGTMFSEANAKSNALLAMSLIFALAISRFILALIL